MMITLLRLLFPAIPNSINQGHEEAAQEQWTKKQYCEGALLVKIETVVYYNTVAASYGLQAGSQSFDYAMFLMTDEAFQYLQKSSGWEIGVSPSIVVVDKGAAKSLTTSTAKDDIYAFFFGQKGLMAGLGLQGSKITKIDPDK